jgi:hypothetical protein
VSTHGRAEAAWDEEYRRAGRLDVGCGGEVDLALDVFVYKHQIQPDERRAYREELARVLAAEVADVLTLVMVWRQERMGVMHGRRYRRRTFATLWRRG